MPFDEFTIEQLAGDLLPNRTTDTLVATGFNRNTLTNREGGTDPEQFRDEQVLDRAATLGTVWLGLTVGCAQCHNHKFDPISQKEFYQLSAFFNTQEEVNIPAPLPGEIGPYLAARPEYERKRQRAARQYGIPAAEADWENKLRYAAAASRRARRLGFRLRRIHPHRRQRQEGAVPRRRRSAARCSRRRMTDTFISSCGNLFPKAYCAGLETARTAHEAQRARMPSAADQLRAGAAGKRYAAQDLHPHQGRLARARRRGCSPTRRRFCRRCRPVKSRHAARRWRAGWCRRRIRSPRAWP